MYAVIFEVVPKADGKEEYLKIAGKLREFLQSRKGFISIERFQSLAGEGKILSLSFWEDEESIESWRNLFEHRSAQRAGRERLFEAYRIRVAKVVRDYTEAERSHAPADSNLEWAHAGAAPEGSGLIKPCSVLKHSLLAAEEPCPDARSAK